MTGVQTCALPISMSPRITIPANTKKRTRPELLDCAGAFAVAALFTGAGVVEID